MNALPTELNRPQVSEVNHFFKHNRRAALLIATLLLIAIAGLLYAYGAGYLTGTQTGQNEIGDPATGCTSYSCINHVQWVNNPMTGVKECRTC